MQEFMQVVEIDGIKNKEVGAVKISTNLSLGERAWGLTHKNAGSKRVLKKTKKYEWKGSDECGQRWNIQRWQKSKSRR